MTEACETEAGEIAGIRAAVIAAALPHVPFDGWTDKTLALAVADTGADAGLSRMAFPRGGLDLALAYHYARDAQLAERLAAEDLLGLKFRDRVARAILLRLELVEGEREEVRRGIALFALPQHAADGARGLWHTADTIWSALGDTSRDFNWYSKRATLSAVYSSALLYWLGDQSEGHIATRDFVQRRIENVMQIEDVKARIARNPVAAAMLKGPQRLLERVRAPGEARSDLPGSWRCKH